MNREELLVYLDRRIKLAESELQILRLEQERTWKMRFAALIAQSLYLRAHWSECKDCKESAVIHASCLESRMKTGKCIFEVGVEQLEKMPWPCRRS